MRLYVCWICSICVANIQHLYEPRFCTQSWYSAAFSRQISRVNIWIPKREFLKWKTELRRVAGGVICWRNDTLRYGRHDRITARPVSQLFTSQRGARKNVLQHWIPCEEGDSMWTVLQLTLRRVSSQMMTAFCQKSPTSTEEQFQNFLRVLDPIINSDSTNKIHGVPSDVVHVTSSITARKRHNANTWQRTSDIYLLRFSANSSDVHLSNV